MKSLESEKALLAGIIDYAGTFPPAALTLEDALSFAATYRRTGRYPWLMSKIALPLKQITGLDSEILFRLGADGTPWLYTALGTKNENPDEFAAGVEWDVREIRRFNERRRDSALRQSIVGYETKIPDTWLENISAEGVFSNFAPVLSRFAALFGNDVTPFMEVGKVRDWPSVVPILCDGISQWQHEEGGSMPVGLKFRTGGATPPTASELAATISACAQFHLKFKATQGLHHPISTESEFGFLNLFASLSFAYLLGTDTFGPKQIEACLTDTSTKAFVFREDQLNWNEFSIQSEQIEGVRRIHGATFGSCSLKEPEDFLTEYFES